MKRFKFILYTMLILLIATTPVYAYNSKTTYQDDGGWVIDGVLPEYTCSVELNLLLQNDQPGLNQYFSFVCEDGNFENGDRYGEFSYAVFVDKNKIIDSVDGYNIIRDVFYIEPGTYDFYGNPFMHVMHINFSDMKHVIYPNTNMITLKDGESVKLYVMFGDYEWAQEHMENFENWGREREGMEPVSYNETEQSSESSISENAVSITPISDPEVTLTETTKLPEDDQSEEKNISLFPYIKVGAIILIILGACIFIIKRRED